MREWFGSIEPVLYITHNFGYRVSDETGEKSLKDFYNRLQRRVHGRNWCGRKTEQPMIALGMWEHLESNRHCHVVLVASRNERAWVFEEGADWWLKLQSRGQLDFSKIESLPKVISYNTKEIYAPNSLDQLFVYKAPLSKA